MCCDGCLSKMPTNLGAIIAKLSKNKCIYLAMEKRLSQVTKMHE
jgi:hypothetical protein